MRNTYLVEIDDHCLDGYTECACGSCAWKGPFGETNPIEQCSLTPGDESPAGRCPECDALVYIADCEGCGGTGIRPDSTNHNTQPVPDGFVCVERCDSCLTYESDIEAARAWGDDAREWEKVAIARPRTRAIII